MAPDRCLQRGIRDGRNRRLRASLLRRNEYEVQLGYRDPSILPREAEAQKTCSLAVEDHVQQQRVDEQREQQRTR